MDHEDKEAAVFVVSWTVGAVGVGAKLASSFPATADWLAFAGVLAIAAFITMIILHPKKSEPCPCGSRGCTKCKGGRGDY